MDSKAFEYFNGSIEEMAHVAEGDQKCTFCEHTGTCFDLGGGAYGCFACLRQGRFFFDYGTEIGHLTPAGTKRFYPSQKKVPKRFNRATFAALLRTPQFTTWQGEEWLIHCDDFMIYLGEWKPGDFRQKAQDGDARKLFLEMTNKELAHLWDAATPKGAGSPSDWYATYYAFKCLQCGALRGYWDCP